MKTFLISYNHDGAQWSVELKARDIEDAKARLAKLPYARLDGEMVGKVPATLGPFAMAMVAIRNGFSRLMGNHA